MSERAEVCNSSGVPLVESNSTSFPCPICGTHIGRSPICRNQGVTYVCTDCDFTGPWGVIVGEVAVQYKVMPDPDVEVAIDDLINSLKNLDESLGKVHRIEKKPLAFGLMFVELHAVVEDEA